MKKNFYFLAAVELHFIAPDGELGTHRMNVVSISDRKTVNAIQIGRIQQNAQIQYQQHMTQAGVGELQFVHVVLMNLIFLGEMTEQEMYRGIDRQAQDEQAVKGAEAVTASKTL